MTSLTDEEDADEEEEEEEEDFEEAGAGNRLLGFMFGNVDNSGDLDVDYLDEDAKEHLAALADKLGSSLKDIDLSVKSPLLPADLTEQDYDEKAEDAVDYEDFDEQYEGPEILGSGEEDHLLSKKDFFSSHAILSTVNRVHSAFDDDNYDDIEEEDKKDEEEIRSEDLTVEKIEFQDTYVSDQHDYVPSIYEDIEPDGIQSESPDKEVGGTIMEDPSEAEIDYINDRETGPSLLPILCVEDGRIILRFSEIFGIQESLKKGGRRQHRQPAVRERYKPLESFSLVEEDDETFLKSCAYTSSLNSVLSKHSRIICYDDKSDSTPFGDSYLQLGNTEKEKRIHSFESAEPLREELCFTPFSSMFYPLDQQDWEEQIIWDNSPSESENSVGSCENSEEVPRISFYKDRERLVSTQTSCMEVSINIYEKRQFNSHIVLESFDAGFSKHNCMWPSKSGFHPQHLLWESPSGNDKRDLCEDIESKTNESCSKDAFLLVNKVLFQNKDMVEGCWLDDILWEQKPNHKPKLILDLQDEKMLFELSDQTISDDLQLHARAMIISPSQLPRPAHDLLHQGYHSGWKFNIANDKFYIKGKSTQQLQTNSTKRVAFGIKVYHSAAAIKLQTMKYKLSNKDLANFHRPKALWYPHDNEVAVKEQAKLSTSGSMKIILKSLGGKGSKLHVSPDETISSVKAKASKKLDFKISEEVKIYYLGKELEDMKSLTEQDVRPNSLLHLVRTRIHLLPRAQRIPGDNKSLRPPGAFKKKSDLSIKDGHIFIMEYCEERPLLLSNPGMGANLCSYYQKSDPSDQSVFSFGHPTSLGNIVTLEPSDKSPFLGDIRPGCSQPALVTNMYRSPLFPHKVPSTDFLLVRSSKGKLSLRRIDKIAVVGQQEPLMEVFSPGSKNVQAYMINKLLVHVFREFRDAEKRGIVPWIRVEELMSLFPNLSEAIVKKKLKECSVLRKDAKGHFHWCKKRDFIIPSEEDLKKLVAPENVCAYESMQAGVYHLKHLGITKITVPGGVSAAMSQLPDEAIALAAASHIERELQITPWSLSSNFVSCLNQDRENIERLEITGVGDPSGRGLGFSFVRAAPKAPMSAAAKKKSAAGRGGSTVTGTDADLRRLSMDAAREVLMKFNVSEDQIAKMTRWHRIAMIRKLSSEQAASDIKVDSTTISKYARGQRMSFLQLQQQTREKCQEIWDRQAQCLSACDYDDNQSDCEENSDLDSFAGDLENLLDAEEFEVNVGNSGSMNEKSDSVKGIKMRRRASLTQAEEEIEDEEAEAAELCRLLMDDDDADLKKKKKTKAPTALTKVTSIANLSSVVSIEDIKSVKKDQSTKPSYYPSENTSENLKEVETVLIKRKSSEKKKPVIKNEPSNIAQFTPRIKIVSENIKTQNFKEKKSARESFVCGACGQLGHMKTNKHCPKYREGSEVHIDAADSEKAPGKSNTTDPPAQPFQKSQKKISVLNPSTKAEPSESEKSIAKAKAVPWKIKCGPTEGFVDKSADGIAKASESLTISDAQLGEPDMEARSQSQKKVKKIKISNKARDGDLQTETRRPSLVIRPPAETERTLSESQKTPSLIIKPPLSSSRDHVSSSKPSIVIKPPAEREREQAHKKIVIKHPKEVVEIDQAFMDEGIGFEYRKTKKMVELTGMEKYGSQGSSNISSKKKVKVDRRWVGGEGQARGNARLREDVSRTYREENMMYEEQNRLMELRRYEELILSEREEEESLKAKKNKKKNKPDIGYDFSEDYKVGRHEKRVPEREKGIKRRAVADLGRYGSDDSHIQSAKRRRGGEVGLANILEQIVDTLKNNTEVSYLFQKPVSKKVAPDYYDIVERPMDLSTIREKVRKMEYRSREDFRHDVCQITINAHIYNDRRHPAIPPLADQLLEICDYLLKEHDESLTEAEERIEPIDYHR